MLKPLPTVLDVIAVMEQIAPPALALANDPIGLQAGEDLKHKVGTVLLALDASLPVLDEAKRQKADLLVVHHPRFYHGLSRLSPDDPSGRRAMAIARSGLAIYAAHTNLDCAPGGVNEVLAARSGLPPEAKVIEETYQEKILKLAVFVPASHVDKVRAALGKAGAGAIGAYADCTFRVRGVGTFRGGAATKPFIGQPGVLEEVDEYRLETVVGELSAGRVLQAMLAAHPYEEVAYDLYPLLGSCRSLGFGRVGELSAPVRLDALARRLGQVFASKMTQYLGRPEKRVKRLATWAGGGVEVQAVLAVAPDALVAGEVGYHDLEAFQEAGVGVISLGHAHSEAAVLPPLAKELRRRLPGVAVKLSQTKGWGMCNA